MCLLSDGGTCRHIGGAETSQPLGLSLLSAPPLRFVPAIFSASTWLTGPLRLSNYLFPSPLHFLNKLLPVCLAQLLIT